MKRKIPLHHIKLSRQLVIKNLIINVDHHIGDKWFIHGPTLQGESVAKPGTPLPIILNIVCKSHIEQVRGNLSNPFFRKGSPWTETS